MKYVIPYYLFINEASSKEIIDHWKSKIPQKILDTFKTIVDNNVQFLDKICKLYDDGNNDDELIVPFASITKAKKLNDPLANKIKPDDIQNLTNLISITKPLLDKDVYYASNTNSYKNYDGGKLTYKKIQDDDKILLISYHSITDGVYFGDRRGWCTGDTTLRIFDNGKYTKDYLAKGDIYFIVDKKRYNKDHKDVKSCMQLSIKRDGKYEFRGQDNETVTGSSAIFNDYLSNIGVKMANIPLPDDLLDMSKFHPQLHPFLDILTLNNIQKSYLNTTPDGKKIILDKPQNVDFFNFDCNLKTFLDNTQFSKITIDLEHDMYKKTDLYKELEKQNVKFEFINTPYEIIMSGNNIKKLTDYVVGEKIERFFYCDDNYLTSLEGAPKHIGKSFNCSYNDLISLEYAPIYIGGSFDCNNNKLNSLQYAPEYVGKHFNCIGNKLTSLDGIPKTIGGDFSIDKSCGFSEDYIRSLSDIKGKVILFKK